MPRYQPYPIYDFKSGLRLDREPWLIPEDAFSELLNAFFDRGILKKRPGYTLFNTLVHAVDAEALDTTVASILTYSGTLAHTFLRATDLTITDGGGPHETFSDNGNGTLTGDSGGSGTINYSTGAWSITYNSDPGNGLSITADYLFYPSLPVTMLANFETATGTREIVACDTKRLCVWNATNSEWDPIGDSDVWTGDETNLFDFVNWKDRLFIVNNEDVLKYYNGTTILSQTVDFDGGATNDLDAALLIKVYKGRLLFLRPTESGSLFPQRARWGAVNVFTDYTNDGYLDISGGSWIQGAEFLGDVLVGFTERETYKLEYTGYSDASDAGNPFQWTRISDKGGALSPFGVLQLENELIAVGRGHIIGTDGINRYNLDLMVPYITSDINQNKIEIIYGAVSKELNQAYLCYPSVSATRNDKTIVIGTDENKWWGKYSYGFNVVASVGEGSASPGMDSFAISGDEAEFSWDDRVVQAGFPLMLAGDHQGNVFRLNYGGSDNGSDIEFKLRSKQWNPFVEAGKQARLGEIAMYVERDSAVNMTLSIYADNDAVPYRTVTINCGSDREISEGKTWKRIWAGGVGNSHTIEISYTASNQTPVIHAIVPYFAEAGPLR